MMLKDVASLWIGKRLGPIELASIRSFQRQGHVFTLFAYDPIENCPPGVTLRDAREVLDLGRIVLHHRTQSPALHSDLFRYALVAKTGFVWVDLDIVALRPFDFPDDYVFGYEATDWLNGAVFRLPPQSPALLLMLAFNADTRGLPPHLTGLRKAKYFLRNLIAGGLPIERWPWGALGPKLLTITLRQTGEISRALPISAFYSVPLEQAPRFAAPGGYDAAQAPADAIGVHLWGSHLMRYVASHHDGVFPADSFVNRVCNDDW